MTDAAEPGDGSDQGPRERFCHTRASVRDPWRLIARTLGGHGIHGHPSYRGPHRFTEASS